MRTLESILHPARAPRRRLPTSAPLLLAFALSGSPLAAQTTVTFPSSDGGLVYADQYGDGARAVVLVPGARFDRTSWSPQAPVLAHAGFRVLAIDLRGHGQTRAGRLARGGEPLDVLAAVRYLRAHGATSVSLVGASLGGYAAGQAAIDAKPGEVDRVVLLAAVAVEHPEKLPGRKLFSVARGDLLGSGRPRLDVVRGQFEAATEPKRLLVLDGSAHAQFLFRTDEGPKLLRAIVDFLREP